MNTDDAPKPADAIESDSMRARRAITEADERARACGDETIEEALSRELERAL